MKREASQERSDWIASCEEDGFLWHSMGGVYWNESARWVFTLAEIEELEAAGNEVHAMCLGALGEIARLGAWERLGLSPLQAALADESWKRKDPSVYGRFDMAWNGQGAPKILEYNADTPTSLLEASVIQWRWLEEAGPKGADQFNSIHEKLIARWKLLREVAGFQKAHFSAIESAQEDVGTWAYMMDCALQGGLDCVWTPVGQIGWDKDARRFVGQSEEEIELLAKIYPWEFMCAEEFGPMVKEARTQFMEPAWKGALSCKGILPFLWEMNKGHPNLLPASFDPQALAHLPSLVKKPVFSREGANVEFTDGSAKSDGPYGKEGYVWQQEHPLAQAPGGVACFGVWMVGDEACGLGAREDKGKITTNGASFVPHCFLD